MASVLETRKVHRRDVNRFVLTQAYRLKDHARQMAAREGRPYQYFGERTRKEDLARQLAERDGITEESTLRQRAPAQALDQSPPPGRLVAGGGLRLRTWPLVSPGGGRRG